MTSRIIGKRSGLTALGVAVMLGITACGDDDRGMDEQTRYLAQTVDVCDTRPRRSELIEMLDGMLAIVAGFSEDGFTASQIVGGFATQFVLNSIDFDALDRWNAQFSNGRYRVRNGSSTLDLYLIAGEPLAGYQPGDTVRENLFASSTYVRNVSVNLSGVSYDRGPLFGLISGGISWRGTTPRFRLDAARLKLGVASVGRWQVRWSETDIDTMEVRNTLVPLDLAALKADFAAGRLGFSYDSTTHVGRKLRIRQTIDSSMFLMKPLDEDGTRWSWEGTYRSRVARVLRGRSDSLTLVVRGDVSTVHGNGWSVYCGEDGTGLLGNAVVDPSLLWGYFESVWGDLLLFGMRPADK